MVHPVRKIQDIPLIKQEMKNSPGKLKMEKHMLYGHQGGISLKALN